MTINYNFMVTNKKPMETLKADLKLGELYRKMEL
jgi:hypothetical protein